MGRDLTRERIAELLKFPHNIQVEEIRPLLDMASRSVSEETVRMVHYALTPHPPGMGSALPRPSPREVGQAAIRDLKPAAEAIRARER